MLKNNLLKELQELLPNKVTTEESELKNHNNVSFYINHYLPDAVCYATDEFEIIKLVNFCLQHRLPLIAYGSGTSVEGHTAAIHGGICLNLQKMNRVLEANFSDGFVIVEPGISYNELNHYLAEKGFHFPVEAGFGASIGGMVATNASGAGATDVGSMAKNVISCDIIVYKDNQACKITTATNTQKSSAGYNINNLFIGSEGTLGIISKITLRIRKNFSLHKTLCCQFNQMDDAINFVIAMKGKIRFRRVELLDILQTHACIAYSGIDFLDKEKNTLLIEIAGNKQAIEEEAELLMDYLSTIPASIVHETENKDIVRDLWTMRKFAAPAAIAWVDKNKKAINTDLCVPLSHLNECILECNHSLKTHGIIAPLVAHVGDGNFHYTLLVNPQDPKEMEKITQVNECLVKIALRYGGTCTAEHGIGLGKISSLEKQHPDTLFIMKKIKKALDPLSIFNPGKIFN